MKMVSDQREIEIPVADIVVINEFDEKTNHWTRVFKVIRYAGARSIILDKSELDNSILGYDYELGLSFIELKGGGVIYIDLEQNQLQVTLHYLSAGLHRTLINRRFFTFLQKESHA